MVIKIFGNEVYLRKEIIAVIAVLLLFFAGTIGYFIGKEDGQVIIKNSEYIGRDSTTEAEKTGEKANVDKADTKTEEEEIKVFVTGCVKVPGIVTLKKGQMVYDAISAAGGLTEEADYENINMVYELKSNVMLKIKARAQDRQQPADTNKAGMVQGAGVIDDSYGFIIISDDGNSGTETDRKININTASVSELDTLPGIGEETAKDIVQYREKNGKFNKITDIMNIKGIKDAKFDKIKDYIEAE